MGRENDYPPYEPDETETEEESCAACHGDGFVLASDVGESGSEFGDFEDGYITCPDCNGSGINE